MNEEPSSSDPSLYSSLAEKIFATIIQQQGVNLSTVIFIPVTNHTSPFFLTVHLPHLDPTKARTVPKTTSGKIARQWVKKSYLEGQLSSLYHLDSLSLQASRPLAGPSSSPSPRLTLPDEFTTQSFVLPPSEPPSLLSSSEVEWTKPSSRPPSWRPHSA
jgi:hypothetical protein